MTAAVAFHLMDQRVGFSGEVAPAKYPYGGLQVHKKPQKALCRGGVWFVHSGLL